VGVVVEAVEVVGPGSRFFPNSAGEKRY